MLHTLALFFNFPISLSSCYQGCLWINHPSFLKMIQVHFEYYHQAGIFRCKTLGERKPDILPLLQSLCKLRCEFLLVLSQVHFWIYNTVALSIFASTSFPFTAHYQFGQIMQRVFVLFLFFGNIEQSSIK